VWVKKLLRPGALIPLLMSLLLLLFVGVFALTREADGDFLLLADDPILAFLADDDNGEEPEDLPLWVPPAPARWFRSNAGGMALEEIPSRLAALRNRYALVIDFVSPDELDPFLAPFFGEDFYIQIRVLFEDGEESRRQWLFMDGEGTTRLNAVFRRPVGGAEGGFDGMDFRDDDGFLEEYFSGTAAYAEPEAGAREVTGSAPVGFVEVFNENGRILRDYLFAEDGTETMTAFFYNGDLLIRAETRTRDPDDRHGGFRNLHTDLFRYNRSFSLRYVQRVFYYPVGAEPVRLSFPYRVLDAAFQDDFIRRRVTPGSEFLDTFDYDLDFDAGGGFNVRYQTDARGRVLTQTMFDDEGEIVWEIRNTWYGDRIVAISRTEDGDERLTEFEFDGEGNRIVQREIRNGVLERLVRTDGPLETEELYMDGVLVLIAMWEGGRRISEERVRR